MGKISITFCMFFALFLNSGCTQEKNTAKENTSLLEQQREVQSRELEESKQKDKEIGNWHPVKNEDKY